MSLRIHTRGTVAIAALLMGMSGAMADNPTAPSTPSKETREKMATFHEGMAACLRSDTPIAECRSEMMKNFRDLGGESGCPMMGGGMPGQMMQDQGTHPRATTPGTPK